MSDSGDKCRICGQSREWHDKHHPRHTFVGADDAGGMAQLGPRRDSRHRQEAGRIVPSEQSHVKVLRGLPSDPALRVILLRAGVITLDQLQEAEREIREAQESGSIVVVAPESARPESSDRPDPGVGDGDSTGRGVRHLDPVQLFPLSSVSPAERGGEST